MPPLEQENQIFVNADVNKDISINHYFNWFEENFITKLTHSNNSFLAEEFEFKFLSFDNKQNFVWEGNDYFVTQIEASENCFIHIRLSDSAIKLILDKALGEKDDFFSSFNIKNITELEARIITSYNEYLFKNLKNIFNNRKKIGHVQPSENVLHLIFMIYSKNSDETGKIIFSFPDNIIKKPKKLDLPAEDLDISTLQDFKIPMNILAGKTKLTLEEIKNMEAEDIILLDNSNKNLLFLSDYDYQPFNVNTNPNIIIDFNEINEGVFDMEENNKPNINIWDNLQMDVSAEFKKIKMKLGELKQITEGLVIDIDPIVENEILLHVEGKALAKGELVILGDNYGVKITKVIKEEESEFNKALQSNPIAQPRPQMAIEQQMEQPVPQQVQKAQEQAPAPQQDSDEDEDFDYSDFEIDDDI